MTETQVVRFARSAPTQPSIAVLAFATGLLVPLKAARIDVGGLSLYFSYGAAVLVTLLYARQVVFAFKRWFAVPFAVLTLFALLAVLRGAGLAGPSVTLVKFLVAFGTAATFVPLLRHAERPLYNGLFAGVVMSVSYMVYQWISSVFFGFSLPFTSSAVLKIGLGLSQRYGLARVTGFTEEPSFIATLLVGSILLLYAHARRTVRPTLRLATIVVGGLGLALCTSNNLFATSLILASTWPLVRRRRIAAVLGVYYLAALVVTPLVLLRDTTYFARFSAYSIFLRADLLSQLVGRGLGAYPTYFREHPVIFKGQPVESLASVWGGFLFEGGALLVILVIGWLAFVVRRATWREGLALFAVLLMLSNYNSPWWPLVCLSLAQCLILHRKDRLWKMTSTSPASHRLYGGRRPSSPSWQSLG